MKRKVELTKPQMREFITSGHITLATPPGGDYDGNYSVLERGVRAMADAYYDTPKDAEENPHHYSINDFNGYKELMALAVETALARKRTVPHSRGEWFFAGVGTITEFLDLNNGEFDIEEFAPYVMKRATDYDRNGHPIARYEDDFFTGASVLYSYLECMGMMPAQWLFSIMASRPIIRGDKNHGSPQS